MTERERAEQLVNDIHSRVDRDGELDDYWRNLCVMDVLAFMREERARALSECAEYIIETDPQASKEFFAEAKALREDGGQR